MEGLVDIGDPAVHGRESNSQVFDYNFLVRRCMHHQATSGVLVYRYICDYIYLFIIIIVVIVVIKRLRPPFVGGAIQIFID